jgi:AcrR family transcriptional regulator
VAINNIDQPYHHPNLRQTLLDAAVVLIGEVGPRAFTLREIARRAGVSHNAPYRHFASKDDLLAAVAAEGFERLTATMRASQQGSQSPSERLILAGHGYVEFALHWPNHFAVLFDFGGPPAQEAAAPREAISPQGAASPQRAVSPPIDCPPANVGEEAFRVLLDSIVAVQQSGDLPPGDPMPHAFTAWSLVHGIAKLAIGGNLPMNHNAILEFTSTAARRMLTPHPGPAKS